MTPYETLIQSLDVMGVEELVELLHDVKFSTRVTFMQALSRFYTDKEDYEEMHGKLMRRKENEECKL